MLNMASSWTDTESGDPLNPPWALRLPSLHRTWRARLRMAWHRWRSDRGWMTW